MSLRKASSPAHATGVIELPARIIGQGRGYVSREIDQPDVEAPVRRAAGSSAKRPDADRPN
jgi:hypothetical protein